MSISVTTASKFLHTESGQDHATLVVPDKGIGAMAAVNLVMTRISRLTRAVEAFQEEQRLLARHDRDTRHIRPVRENLGGYGVATAGSSALGDGGGGGGGLGGLLKDYLEYKGIKTLLKRLPKSKIMRLGGKALGWAGTAYGAYDLYQQGSKTGKVSAMDAGMTGIAPGAELGAAIGTAFFGIGAVPGAVIGGAIGFAGGYAGAEIYNYREELKADWDAVANWSRSEASSIGKDVEGAYHSTTTWMEDKAKEAGALLHDSWDGAKSWMADKTEEVVKDARQAWVSTTAAFKRYSSLIGNAVADAWESVVKSFDEYRGTVSSWIEKESASVSSWLGDILQELKKGVTTSGLKEMASRWLSSLRDWMTSLGHGVMNWGKSLFSGPGSQAAPGPGGSTPAAGGAPTPTTTGTTGPAAAPSITPTTTAATSTPTPAADTSAAASSPMFGGSESPSTAPATTTPATPAAPTTATDMYQGHGVQQPAVPAPATTQGTQAPAEPSPATDMYQGHGYQDQKRAESSSSATGLTQGQESIVQMAASKAGEMTDRDDRDLAQYLKTGGHGMDPARIDWCAAFVGATLKKAGFKDLPSNIATSYARYGTAVDAAHVKAGDVGILMRGRQAGMTGGHVGIMTGKTDKRGRVQMLAGDTDWERTSNGHRSGVDYEWEDPSKLTVRRPVPLDAKASPREDAAPQPTTISEATDNSFSLSTGMEGSDVPPTLGSKMTHHGRRDLDSIPTTSRDVHATITGHTDRY